MAAKVGLKCSTFINCRYTVLSGESAQCGVGYTGYSYIHVEYECLTSEYSFSVDTMCILGVTGIDMYKNVKLQCLCECILWRIWGKGHWVMTPLAMAKFLDFSAATWQYGRLTGD